MSDLKCKKPKLCEPVPVPDPVPCSPAFDLCVGDRTLKWDGFCPTVERTRNTPDGTYTSVTVVDGCIVDYGYADTPTYTPPYCNPNPTHCQDTGNGTGSGSVTVSPNHDNNLMQTPNGLYARTHVQGGTGVRVVGTGTVQNPYVVSMDTVANGAGTKVIVARNGLEAETTPNGVTYVGLAPTNIKAGSFDITDQFSVDQYGRITNVEKRNDPLVTAGAGLVATPQGDSVQIGHETNDIDNNMVLGAYGVTTTDTGHITATNRLITVEAGVYNLGAYNVGINEYGSVSSIVQRTDVLPADGTFTTADGKTFKYDITGRLTELVGAGNQTPPPTGLPTAPPLPIRAMYKIHSPTEDNVIYVGLLVESYGEPIKAIKSGRRESKVSLPSYVVSKDQIVVGGDGEFYTELSPLSGELIIRHGHGNHFITLAFRG